MKKKNEKININDDSIKFIPDFIRNLFIKEYLYCAIVHFKETEKGKIPVYFANKFKILENLNVRTYSRNRSYKLSFDYLNKKYPNYYPYMQIY